MSVSEPDWPDSPLDAVDAAFAALTTDPEPLTLDLDTLGQDTGLPRGVMALPALRDWLLAHPRAYQARDAVWRDLIRRARLDGPSWVIAAVAMAMPALRRHAGELHAGWSGDAADLDAEILTGFLTALRDRVDLAKPAPYAGLCMAAWRAGHELRLRTGNTVPVEDVEHVTGPRTPRVPYGHPDLLVRRAARLGLLEHTDLEAYIDLRLGGRAIEPIAARLGVSVDALRKRMNGIDARLADASPASCPPRPASTCTGSRRTAHASATAGPTVGSTRRLRQPAQPDADVPARPDRHRSGLALALPRAAMRLVHEMRQPDSGWRRHSLGSAPPAEGVRSKDEYLRQGSVGPPRPSTAPEQVIVRATQRLKPQPFAL
ncbi:hypothetical protein [Micromonospora sp. 4G55]|uniref:hypothetical protein n=1 Tax=Micromonospora sp. 4G55 TaxID=2806102 RepID=UPI0035C66F6A